MNDYNTARLYLAALKNEVLNGQKISIDKPEINLVLSTEGEVNESLNAQLCEENKQLKEQIQKLQNELNSFYEPPTLTEEDLAEAERLSREFEEYQQAELDKMLTEAKEEVKRKSVLISTLIQKVKDIPDYRRQLDVFHILSELLSDNTAWQQVSGPLITQINEMQRERSKLQPVFSEAKFDSMFNVTGNQSVTIGQQYGEE